MHFVGKIRVNVCSGKILNAHDVGGKADPYVKLTYNGHSHKTKAIRNTLEPEWNAVFEFDTSCEGNNTTLLVECWDKDLLKDDFIGKGQVDHLEQYVNNTQTVTVPIFGLGKKGSTEGAIEGNLIFRIVVMTFESATGLDGPPVYTSAPAEGTAATTATATSVTPVAPVYSSVSLRKAPAAVPPSYASTTNSSSSSSSEGGGVPDGFSAPYSSRSNTPGDTGSGGGVIPTTPRSNLPPPIYAASSSPPTPRVLPIPPPSCVEHAADGGGGAAAVAEALGVAAPDGVSEVK